MSIQQLEQKVRDLDAAQFAQFASWFDAYRETIDPPHEEDPELSCDQRAEIERRLNELKDDLSNTVLWEGTMEEVKKIREEIRAEKACHPERSRGIGAKVARTRPIPR